MYENISIVGGFLSDPGLVMHQLHSSLFIRLTRQKVIPKVRKNGFGFYGITNTFVLIF